MKKHEIFLNFAEIKQFTSTLKSIDLKIDYYKYFISVCNEAKNNLTDEDVEKFIVKYHLTEKIDGILDEYPLIHKENCDFAKSGKKFSNETFNTLHEKLSLLNNSYIHEINKLDRYTRTVSNNFEFAFLEDQVYRKFDEYEDKRKSLMWIKELERKLNRIYDLFPDSLLAKLFQDFDLGNYFYVNESPKLVTVNGFLCLDTKYQNFKDHLNRHFLPFITKQKELLEMDIAIEDTKNYLSNGVTNEDVIFRLWDFDFNKVKFFSDNAFDSIEYKIQYLSYVIKCLKIKIPVNIQNSKFSTELSKIEEELKYLQTSYDLKKSKGTSAKVEINSELLSGIEQVLEKISEIQQQNSLEPKNSIKSEKKDDETLIKYYFDIAKKCNDVPKLRHLEANKYSIPSWSKKLNDIFFLTKVLTLIEASINDKRNNDSTCDLFIRLKHDINSRILKAQERVRKMNSYKSPKQRPITEEYEDEDAFDRTQYYDKSLDG